MPKRVEPVDDDLASPEEESAEQLTALRARVRLTAIALGVIAVLLLVIILSTGGGGDSDQLSLGDQARSDRELDTTSTSGPASGNPGRSTTDGTLPAFLLPIPQPYPVPTPGAPPSDGGQNQPTRTTRPSGGGGGGGGATTATTAAPARPSSGRTANGPAGPQIQRFFADPDRPQVGERVAFRWSAGDADGILRAFNIDFGDGASDGQLLPDRCAADPSDPVSERPAVRHSYDRPGRYRVILTAYSSGACGDGPVQSATAELTIEVTLPGGVGI